MNWKLIFQLSLFGLAMGVATVFVIPSTIEPLFWLAILVFCAYRIARGTTQRRFLHGMLVSMVNSVWITASHVLLFNQYSANHAEEMAMMASMPFGGHPRRLMLLMGPVIGVMSGLLLGLFALVAGKLTSSKHEVP